MYPRTVTPRVFIHSQALTTERGLIEEYLTSLVLVHQLAIGLR